MVEAAFEEHPRRGVGQLLAHQALLALAQPFGLVGRGVPGRPAHRLRAHGLSVVQSKKFFCYYIFLVTEDLAGKAGSVRGAAVTDIHIVCDYPHPPAKVWRAVTDPDLIPLWTATGQGGRPVGFAPVPGIRFQFVARPAAGLARHRRLRGPRGARAVPAAVLLDRRRQREDHLCHLPDRAARRRGALHLRPHRFHRCGRILPRQTAGLGPQEDAHLRPPGRPGRPRRDRHAPRHQYAPDQAPELMTAGG